MRRTGGPVDSRDAKKKGPCSPQQGPRSLAVRNRTLRICSGDPQPYKEYRDTRAGYFRGGRISGRIPSTARRADDRLPHIGGATCMIVAKPLTVIERTHEPDRKTRAGRRHRVCRRVVWRSRRSGRRSLLQHVDDRLSGNPDRPKLSRADRHDDVSPDRELRRQ